MMKFEPNKLDFNKTLIGNNVKDCPNVETSSLGDVFSDVHI